MNLLKNPPTRCIGSLRIFTATRSFLSVSFVSSLIKPSKCPTQNKTVVSDLYEACVKCHPVYFHFQAKQQRLSEDYAAVNHTLEIASDFISETQRTVAEVDAMVQVSPTRLYRAIMVKTTYISEAWIKGEAGKCTGPCCVMMLRLLLLWLPE